MEMMENTITIPANTLTVGDVINITCTITIK